MQPLSKVETLPARAERECNEYLKELKLLVSREKPTNVIQFCIDFFLQKKMALLLRLDCALGQEREVSSATAPEASNEEPASPPPISNRGRRSSVFSESIDPLAQPILRTEFPKSAIDKTMITSALCENFLFNHMEDEQYEAIVSALKEVRIKAHVILVEQGVFDDHFFIVRSGSFDCFTDHVKVATLGPGKSFGELALLHRAAAPCTVIASSDSVVWHLDRLTFRTILAGMSAQRRSLYNDFLRQVPLFGILDENDRCKIADTLTTMHFADEEIVCCEGSCSNAFYFILTGQVAVYQRDGSEFRFIRTLNPGDHFGESALLNNVPQTSTIIARGSLKCATITKDAFFRLVGPLLVHRAEIAPLPRQVSCL